MAYPHLRPAHSMRLLYTSTGHFFSPSNIAGLSYAILSHTWSPDGEQTYQELLKIQNSKRDTTLSCLLQGAGLAASTQNTNVSILDHPQVYEKIRETCRVAREDGYQLVWIDSCCIDKTSSAELSEAINSMYEWYRRADLCYAYLADVDNASRVGVSRWHRRGWTLQELIAPRYLIFMSSHWRPLGTKHSLAHHLQEATGIRCSVLNHEQPLESIPVAERMESWAARRETSREEDEAYSLMGILGVHMTTIYGEGRHAFIRLQEEILKMHPDQSIFAWGPVWRGSRNPSWVPADESSFSAASLSEGQQLNDLCGLLGGSPRCFRTSTATAQILSPISDDLFSSRLGINTSSLQTDFTPTSQGIRMRLPLIPMSAIRIPLLSKDRWIRYQFINEYLAVLQCEDERGNLVALPLIRTSKTSIEFIVGTTRHYDLFRVWSLSWHELEDGLKHIAVTEILIRGRHLPLSSLQDDRREILVVEFIDILLHVGDVIPYKWCRTVLQGQGFELTSSRRECTVLSTPALDSCNSPSISHVFVLTPSDKSEKLSIYICELALLPTVVVTYQTSARPRSDERPIQLLHRPCTDGRSRSVVVSGKTGFQWTYELVVREHILRTVRVELLKTTTAGMEKEREGIYWMTIDL